MIRSPTKVNSTDSSEELTGCCVYSLNTSIQNSWAVKFLFLSTRCLSAQASFLDCWKLGIHISWREVQPGLKDENQNASGLGQLRWLTWASHLWGSHPWQWKEINGLFRTLADREERCYAISKLWKHVSDIFLPTIGSSHVPVDVRGGALPEASGTRPVMLTTARVSDQVWLQMSSSSPPKF